MVAGLGAENSCEGRQGHGFVVVLLCFIPE